MIRRRTRGRRTCLAAWLERPPEVLACAVVPLNDRLFRRQAAVFGVRPGTFRTVCSRLRAVLRLMGGHAPLARGEAMLGTPWTDFLGAAPSHARVGLRNFARWCDGQGIPPDAVDGERLGAFLAEDGATRLSASVVTLHRSLPAAWNKARLVQPDPGQFTVLQAPRRRQPYIKPLS